MRVAGRSQRRIKKKVYQIGLYNLFSILKNKAVDKTDLPLKDHVSFKTISSISLS